MATRIISFFTFLILFGNLCGQTNENILILKHKFQSADSILIISHEITDEYGAMPDTKLEGEEISAEQKKQDQKLRDSLFPKFILNGNINQKIIKESFRLPDSGVVKLSNILLRQVLLKKWAPPKCDQPHHSILIYKNNHLSYIDICFSCFRIHTSKDIEFDEFYVDKRKWEDLKVLFRQNGISQMLKEDE